MELRMAAYDDVINFLEDEARALRIRISDLAEKRYPQGVTTGDGTESDWVSARHAAEKKLAEIERHIRTLRHEV
jgi:hypothetical protein